MKAAVPRTYLALALTFLSPSLAKAEEGRPVTAADISGKTICWSDGWRMTYAADGHYFGDRADKPPTAHPDSRQWVFLEPGVIQYDSRTTDHDHYMKKNAQIVVLPDGQLQRHWFAGSSSKETNGSIWGKVCN